MSDMPHDWELDSAAVEAFPSVAAASLDPDLLALAARIEAHGVDAWPAQEVERWSDGWVLRATPGLQSRGRSNHALVPVRAIERSEYDGAVQRVAAFADKHGVQCGIQVGPLDLHLGLLSDLQVRSWQIQESVCVMTADTVAVAEHADPAFALTVTDHASEAWLDAWKACEHSRADFSEHEATVLRYLRGVGRFFHHGDRAVGISVEIDGLTGLFCIAVNPDARRQGLGKKLVTGILADAASSDTTYLQVFSGNDAGLALYNSLGFTEAYRYCHCVAPSTALAA
jgi:ribosomal protein S18 acetylase RimI-like enzyme